MKITHFRLEVTSECHLVQPPIQSRDYFEVKGVLCHCTESSHKFRQINLFDHRQKKSFWENGSTEYLYKIYIKPSRKYLINSAASSYFCQDIPADFPYFSSYKYLHSTCVPVVLGF